MSTQNKFGVWGWVAVFSIGGAVVLITESIGIHQKWEDVVVFTVLLFTTLILLYRACWGSPWVLLVEAAPDLYSSRNRDNNYFAIRANRLTWDSRSSNDSYHDG